jgi:predicted transcriptional regulator
MSETSNDSLLLDLTAQIVSAHVSRNAVEPDVLPALIRSIFKTLGGIDTAQVDEPKPEPAVPIKKSVFPDHIVCLEDGKKLKLLKRHLATSFRMTPDEYRKRWGLPADYPMVAPNYAAQRSVLAKENGLGRLRRQEKVPVAPARKVGRPRSQPR